MLRSRLLVLLVRFRHCFPNEVITGIRLDGNELAAMRFTQRWIEGLKKLLTTRITGAGEEVVSATERVQWQIQLTSRKKKCTSRTLSRQPSGGEHRGRSPPVGGQTIGSGRIAKEVD